MAKHNFRITRNNSPLNTNLTHKLQWLTTKLWNRINNYCTVLRNYLLSSYIYKYFSMYFIIIICIYRWVKILNSIIIFKILNKLTLFTSIFYIFVLHPNFHSYYQVYFKFKFFLDTKTINLLDNGICSYCLFYVFIYIHI